MGTEEPQKGQEEELREEIVTPPNGVFDLLEPAVDASVAVDIVEAVEENQL